MFVDKINHLENALEPFIMGAFLLGLKKEIKNELSVLGPTTLQQCMDWAERVDKKFRGNSWLNRKGSTMLNSPHSRVVLNKVVRIGILRRIKIIWWDSTYYHYFYFLIIFHTKKY